MLKLQSMLMGAAAIVAAALMYDGDPGSEAASKVPMRLPRPGYVVDSVRPVEVDLARFREGLGPAPAELTGGAESFGGLIARFARAVEARDTVALQRMQVSAAEYAWLVYPSSPLTRPPYVQAPQIAWMLLRQSGDAGLSRLVQRRGGAPLRITGRHCDPEPLVEGDNRLWRRCYVTTVAGSGTKSEKLFGVVIERHGRFKFVSYQNQY
jgi:hypothetical protein